MSFSSANLKLSPLKALLMAILPLIGLAICLKLMGLAAGESGSAQQSSDEAAGSTGFGSIFILLLAAAWLLAKILALVGNLRHWYYGWVYHAVEINIVLFISGLLLVISVFSAPFSVLGFINVLGVFLVLTMNLYFRRFWTQKEVRDNYQVSHYTHA